MRKIVLDVFGADSPELLIKGAVDTVNSVDDIVLVLSGEEGRLRAELEKYEYPADRMEILPASQIIESGEKPAEAILSKRDSSLVKGLVRTAKDDDVIGMISGGNTGAFLAGCVTFLGRIKGVTYPTLATMLPTCTDKYVCLADCGASIDCNAEQLSQFALLGSALYSAVYGAKEPRVALLNVGTEPGKGNALAHEVFPMLEKLPINFVGNMEAREVTSGRYDVIVCDGFAGNMVLKSIEGSALFTINLMVESMKNSLCAERSKIREITGNVLSQIDLSSLAGAIFMGVKKPVIKMHGNSNDKTIPNVVNQLISLYEGGLIEKTMELFKS